jgi:hypothetical protein
VARFIINTPALLVCEERRVQTSKSPGFISPSFCCWTPDERS